jgi:signal transduction histidine kinase
MTRFRVVLLGLAGVAVGALAFVFARESAEYALVGDSVARATIELVAGYALIAVGLASSRRQGQSRFGVLLIGAGIAWELAEWNDPGVESSVAFTLGLALYAAAGPVVAHAALAYPGGFVARRGERVALAFAYACAVLLLGVLPVLFFDPATAGCAQCPANHLLIHDSAGTSEDLTRLGIQVGAIWSLGLIAVFAIRLGRVSQAARVRTWPVIAPAAVYLGLVAADFVHALGRGFVSNDATDVALRIAQAAALLFLAGGVAYDWHRARRTRRDVAELVLDLTRSPTPGGLRDALAEVLGDPSVELGYHLDDGRLVDARGRPVKPTGEVTPLVRDGRAVATVSHRPGLLDDPGLVDELATAARLALENERLRAEARAQLEDLRASRARIVADGDSERRRLERDLHDGAQQQLVALAFSLRLARSGLEPDADRALLTSLETADAELRQAIAELRELANGIFPAVLADEGLAAALEALREQAEIPIALAELPDERVEPAAEAAAYFLVSESIRRGAAGAVTVSAACRDGLLVVDLQADGLPRELTDLEDRVGAIDGELRVAREDGRVRVTAEIPCES